MLLESVRVHRCRRTRQQELMIGNGKPVTGKALPCDITFVCYVLRSSELHKARKICRLYVGIVITRYKS